MQGQPATNGGYGASFVKANAEFFDSVGTRVVMGRGIGVQDTSTAPTVAVVNEEFVKQYLKGRESDWAALRREWACFGWRL